MKRYIEIELTAEISTTVYALVESDLDNDALASAVTIDQDYADAYLADVVGVDSGWVCSDVENVAIVDPAEIEKDDYLELPGKVWVDENGDE